MGNTALFVVAIHHLATYICLSMFVFLQYFYCNPLNAFIFCQQVKITVPKDGLISALLHEVSIQTGVDKDKVSII